MIGRAQKNSGVRQAISVILLICFGLLQPIRLPVALGQNAPISAEDAKAREEAIELFNQGKAAYKANDFDAAEKLFRRAQARYDKEPLIILALAKTLDKHGDLKTAQGYYEMYLRLAPVGPNFAKDREATVKRLEEIKQTLASLPGTLKLKGFPSGAQLWLDGKVADVDAQNEIKVPAGTHAVKVTMDRRLPYERGAIAVGPGETKEIDVVLLDPVDPSLLPHDHKWTWVAGSAATALLIGTAVFAGLMTSELSDYNQRFIGADGNAPAATIVQYQHTDGSTCHKGDAARCQGLDADAAVRWSSVSTKQNLTIGLGAASVALIGLTVLAYYQAPVKDLDPNGPGKPSRTTLRLVPTFDAERSVGAALSLDW